LGNARRTGAFFATFFLFVFVFLTVVAFLRAAALVTGVFLRAVLPLAFFLVAIKNLPGRSLDIETLARIVAE